MQCGRPNMEAKLCQLELGARIQTLLGTSTVVAWSPGLELAGT